MAFGSNTLADVRDKILCKTDIGVCQQTEIPTNKLETSSVSAKVRVITRIANF